MSSTSSTAHRRDFCRALYLQPSPEKLGRATLYVHLSLVPSDSYTERAKGAKEAKEGGSLIKRRRHHTFQFSVFSFPLRVS